MLVATAMKQKGLVVIASAKIYTNHYFDYDEFSGLCVHFGCWR